MSSVQLLSIEGKGQADPRIDWRESLTNDAAFGPATSISVPTERIARIRGIMVDLDPQLLIPDNMLFRPADDPRHFHDAIRPVLEGHPLIRDAEVRNSGTGLHLITWLDPPLELRTAAEQQHGALVVKAIQSSLPSDPNAPGITSLTRPVGSINSKNGAVVEVIRPGVSIEPSRIATFIEALSGTPFRTLATILIGTDEVRPCPVCRRAGSCLGVLDYIGKCYECGKLTI